jgi:energy-coupling factor transport system permease protein
MAVPKLNYIEGDTALHRLHPLTKLFALCVLCAAVFIMSGWLAPLVAALLLIALFPAARIDGRRLVGILRHMPLFMCVIVVANLLLGDRGLGLGQRALRGLVQGIRVVDVLTATSLFLMITDPVDLSDAIVGAVRPLRGIGVRTGELSLMTMVIFGFIPRMFEEAKRLETAQSVRSRPRGAVTIFHRIVPLVAPLVIGVFRRADELELALGARYFSLDRDREPLKRRRAGARDFSVSLAAVALLIAALATRW